MQSARRGRPPQIEGGAEEAIFAVAPDGAPVLAEKPLVAGKHFAYRDCRARGEDRVKMLGELGVTLQRQSGQHQIRLSGDQPVWCAEDTAIVPDNQVVAMSETPLDHRFRHSHSDTITIWRTH